ncbi:MAG: hypothetical protein LAN71_04710 [Acidobacteriia bacterium]|nr:hypothetical protein [Terriglobia bacterium]
MKRTIAIAAALLVILWLGATPALAQHGQSGNHPGGGPGGTGMPGGAGMGGGAGAAGSAHGSMGNAGGYGGGNHSAASSPTNVLSHNTKLDSTLTSKLQSQGLLPKGTDLKTACAGFKNLGQCIAAIHVSHNRNISFDCLKADMTGQAPAAGTSCPAGTGSKKLSLGSSIQALDPQANGKSEAKTAGKQADADIRDSEAESGSGT